MPDFNKGDFTQQGVAGHVNANIRLNEKRLVNIDMTSNEEAEGCTIAGTVKDLLNNEVYPIGAGVSGNIEITENGENINVAPYATATVNVPALAPERHYVIPEGTYTSIVQGGLSGVYLPTTYFFAPEIVFNIDGVEHILKGVSAKSLRFGVEAAFYEENNVLIEIVQSYMGMSGALIPTTDTEPTEHTISAYYVGEKKCWQIISVDSNSSAQFVQYETLWDEDRLSSKVVYITSGNYSKPILAYPYTNTRIYCCYSSGEATTIICSTFSSPTGGYYNVPNDENNLAFITWVEEIPQ